MMRLLLEPITSTGYPVGVACEEKEDSRIELIEILIFCLVELVAHQLYFG
jgi:hypothetical protein